MSTTVYQIADIPTDVTYLLNLRVQHRYFSLSDGVVFAIADCDSNGKLNSHYCLIEKPVFSTSHSPETQKVLLTCTCERLLISGRGYL